MRSSKIIDFLVPCVSLCGHQAIEKLIWDIIVFYQSLIRTIKQHHPYDTLHSTNCLRYNTSYKQHIYFTTALLATVITVNTVLFVLYPCNYSSHRKYYHHGQNCHPTLPPYVRLLVLYLHQHRYNNIFQLPFTYPVTIIHHPTIQLKRMHSIILPL